MTLCLSAVISELHCVSPNLINKIMKPELIACKKDLKDKFFNLKIPEDIADMLEINYKTLNYLLYIRNENTQYKRFILKKKSGGDRIIYSPVSTLKILQRKLSFILYIIYLPKSPVHGFCFNRSIITNAKEHIKKDVVLNIDLKDFFPSINFGRVYGMFKARPYNLSTEVAARLAKICCYKNQIPQGAPTSPIISNMICKRLDRELKHIARRNQCVYTRYADDITISREGTFPKEMLNNKVNEKDGEKIKEIITKNGFEINDKKVRISSNGERKEVTGLIVNEFPNVKRKFIKEVRAMLYVWEKYGLAKAEEFYYEKFKTRIKQRNPAFEKPIFSKIVKGKINFIKSVRGEENSIYKKLDNKFNKLMKNGIPLHPLTIEEKFKKTVWIIQNNNQYGTAFMLENIGLVTCWHCVANSKKYLKVFRYDECFDVGKMLYVSVISRDVEKDLAILRINGYSPKYYNFLKLGDVNKINEESDIKIVGFPQYKLGDRHLTYRNQNICGPRAVRNNKRWVVDQNLVAGMSGSPVLDESNKVIGIVGTGTDSLKNAHLYSEYTVIPINILVRKIISLENSKIK